MAVGGVNYYDDLFNPNNFLKKVVAVEGDGFTVEGEELFWDRCSKARSTTAG